MNIKKKQTYRQCSTASKIGRTPSRHSVGSLTIKHFLPTEFYSPLTRIVFSAEQCPFISTVSIANFILPASFSQLPSFIFIYTDLTSLILHFTFQSVALLYRQSFTLLKYAFHAAVCYATRGGTHTSRYVSSQLAVSLFTVKELTVICVPRNLSFDLHVQPSGAFVRRTVLTMNSCCLPE